MKNKKAMMNRRKGILIVYEGISGSGKSEAIGKLSRYLSALDFQTTNVEWNSNRAIRAAVDLFRRMGLLTPTVYSLFQWFGFLLEYITVIAPALRQNKIVLADRYLYTALTRDEANGAARWTGRLLFRWFRKPDWVVYYDIPVNVCYERIIARGKELFYPKKLFRRASRKSSDFQYLQTMRTAYLRVFNRLHVQRHSNLLFVKNDKLNVLVLIEQYIEQKNGALRRKKRGDSGRPAGLSQ